MNKRMAIVVAAAFIAIGAAVVWITTRPQPQQPTARPSARSATNEPLSSGTSGLPNKATSSASNATGIAREPSGGTKERRTEELVTEDPSQTNRILRVRADQVLAIVNGVAITLKDLVPLGANETSRAMTEEFYQPRLNRAIDRELTFQVAGGQRMELTPTQQQILDQARAQLRKRQETSDIIWTSVTPEAIEFESREHTARLLQINLLQAAGLHTGEPPPTPYATPELVEQYYKTHLEQYGPLPEEPGAREVAWQKISTQIRQDIQLSVQQEYESKRRRYLDDLRASGSITTNPPSS